jgi:thiamine-phosphate pyrophosphorylase
MVGRCFYLSNREYVLNYGIYGNPHRRGNYCSGRLVSPEKPLEENETVSGESLRRFLLLRHQTIDEKRNTVIERIQKARLYGILDLGYVTPADCEQVTRKMLDGGIQILQLRAKRIPKVEIPELARRLAPLCNEASVPFIINDYPELVAACGADGVHVGQDDMSVDQARALAGHGKIVGLSTHSLAQVKSASEQGPDYIGFGPLFPTPTKPDYLSIGTKEIAQAHSLVDFPIFCIGGIKADNLPQVMKAGARRVVIVSGILQAENRGEYIQACLKTLAA